MAEPKTNIFAVPKSQKEDTAEPLKATPSA